MIQRITATATEALLILLIITTRFINASEVGCYTIWNGTTDTRLLTTSPGFYLTSQILTSSECQLHCAQCSFTHASLEGDFCMCGEVSTLIESMNKNCTQLCADDNSTCGNYVTVYTTPNVVKGLVITQPATGANIEAFVETVYVDVNVTLGADVTYTYDFGDGYVATTNNSHTTHVFRSRGGSKGITVKASTPEMIQPVTASTVVQVESSIKDLQVICPRFVELNATFECIFQLKQGTDIRLHIDFDDGRYFPFTPADSFPYEVGSVQSTAGPTGTVASASMHFLKSHFLRHNGSVVAVEVTLKTAGNVTFELYRPYCQEATAEFCVHLNRCINSTNQCRPVTGKIRCSGDTIYSFRLRTCVFKGNGTVAPHDDQTLGNPPNYRFIDRWSFEVNESGLYYYAMPRTVDIQAGDVPVIGAGSTMEISTFSTSHSATAAFTPNTGDSAYIDRNTTNYIVNQTDMTSHNFDFFVKFYVMRPAITKITHRYAAALGETNFTVSANASNVITNKTVTDSMKIEILVKISNFTLLCEDKGRTHWDFNFTIPEHPGTSPVYSWDFGDGNQANSTELVYIYRYLLPGFYTVTVTARNELNQQSITRNLTVQDTISHVSVDVNDQPATLFGQATTIIVSGTEGSDGIYQLHFGDGSQTQAGLGLFNETHSHQSYFTVSQGRTITESLKQTSINTVDVEVCAKACLTYSQFQCKSFVIDSVQCVLRDVGVAELEASKLEHNKPGTSLYLLKESLCKTDLIEDLETEYFTSTSGNSTDIKLTSAGGWIPNDIYTDYIQIQLRGLSVVYTLVSGVDSTDTASGVTTFNVSSSIDGVSWTNDTLMVDQSTILNTNTLLYTNLTEPITARYFRVYPQSFNSRPSIRIGLQGCGQIRETRTFTHTYTSTGSYNVTLTASNLISDVFGLAEVRVQQPLQDVSVYFPDVIGHSFSGFVVFSAAAGTDIVAEATLMNRTLTKIDYNSTRSGNIEISRPDYGGIGPYNCNATISNYITNPQIFTRVIIIDFIILNPVVSPQQKYINKTSKVVFVVTMDFGSQVNISFDYADAGVTNLTTGLSFVANKTHVTEHVFNDVGMFYVNVTMVNKLSSAVLISTIGVQNPISSLELSTNDPVTMTAGVGQAVLTVRYSGDASNIPTNVTCYFAYGDGSPDEEKSLILNSNQFVVNHPYTNASTYDVTVTLLNEVSSTVLTASIDTDEPITGARLEVDKQYYRVGERVQLRIYFDTGTRVNLTVLWSDGTQSNTLITTGNNVTLSHVYNEVLSSSAINATLSNSLGVTFISLPHTLDTEHPITNAVLTGLSAIEFPINGPSKTVYIDLLLTSGTPLPSNVVWSINWGDGNTDPSQPFSCIASGVITGNTTHTKCISLPGHDYQREGPYDVTVNISNHVSNEVLNFRTTLYKAITALAIEVFYIDASGDNRTGHGPNKNLYPLENTILFKVTHSTGNNLVYTWEFGDDTRQSLDEISAITHNYSLINSYTVNMTASDPLHAESTSINIVLINRAGKIEFFIENPMPRNFTYPIELVVDSVGTDVCYQIDCVAENATLGRFLYFASAMTICRSQFPADSIDGENFKTVSDADLRASGKIGFYNIFHKVAFYTIAATARNYVSNETTENPLTVTKGPCFFPRVDLRNPNRCADAKMCTSSTLNTGVKTHYKSEDLLVLSDVRYNCTTTSIGHFTWRAEGIDRNSGLWVNVTDQLEARNVSLYTDTAAPLFIPKRALDYGLYRFILNVSMDNETGIWKEGHVEIKIVASPLAGGINGGPYQRIPFASDFNFTATDLTYDPDLDPDYWNDGVMIRWFCKMQCEDWPTFDSGYRNTENITTNRCKRIERKRNRGCFSQESVPGAPYAGELRRDYSNPLKPFEIINNNLWLNTSFLFEKSYIDIFMVAVKGNRQVRYNQSVYVMLGKPPIVGLSCVTNCFEDKSEMITKLNPVSRFSVRSVVKGRVGGINYIYGWDLLHYDADFSYLYADNFTIPRSLWSDKASTGLVGADLSLNENYFIAEDYNRYFMLRLNCYREGAEEANALIYYPLMINAPPNVDNTTCTVTPENGTALETRFNMECSGMYDVDLPLKFEFGYSSTGSLTDISWFDANQDPQFSRRSIFPSGFENNGFNLTLYLKTIDGANSFTQIEVAKIKVYPPKTNLEEMNLMLANPNANPAAGLPPQAAAQVWMAFASQVNQEEDTPPVTGNDTNQNSEAERQLNMKKQFRETAASNLASVPVRADLESVKVIGQAASAIVGKPNEVTESALNDIQNICENLDTALQGLADNPSVGAEQVEQACTEQVKLMSNVFDAQSALTEKTGTTEKAGNSTKFAKEATSRMQGLLSGVSSSVLKKKVMGEAPTIITSPSVTMFMKKDSPAAFLNQTLDVGQGHSCAGMKFADNKNMFGNENETAFSLSSQASTVASNPYVWSPEASKVSSPVTSLSMIDDSGHSLNMSNLPDDIEIWIDAGKDQKPVPPVLGWTISDDLLMNTFSVNVSDYGALSVNISQFLNVTTFTRNVTDAYGNVTQEEYDVDYSVNTTYPNQTVRFAIYLRRESQPTTGIYNDLCILPVASRQTRVSNSSENDVNSTGRNIDTDRCAQKRPKSPSLTTCFWDHEQLNITDEKVLFYIGVRAFLDNLTHEVTTENINDQDFVVTQLSSEIYTMSCRYWSDEDDRWSSEGCRVGNRSNIQATQCFCNHLTSFASMFVVPMNVPNFADLSSLSPSELAKNPVALAFMCSIFGVYLLAVIWARWMDGLDKLKVGATPLASNNPRDKYMYEITVYTGFAKNAGTTARVSFILVGDDRESEPRLFEDNKRKIFQAGQTNTFVMATSSTLGQLSHIRVWHDNSGKKPAWFFSRMMIEDIQTGDKFYFICDRWLAVEEDDGQIDRVIPVAGSDELTSFNHLFALKARKNLTDDHLWFSVITRPPRSKFTRVQRLTSILSLLFTSMMASIMFFGNESDVQNPTMIELGPIKFSLHSIYIGVISGLVVVPINIVIVIMFRSVKPCPYSFGGCWAGFRRKCCRKKSPASPSLDSKSLLSSAASEADFKIALEKSHEQIALEGLDEKGVFIINPSMTNYGGGLQPGYPVQPLGMKKEPVKPKKKKFQLPWWMLIFTYMLTFGTIAFSFMWVVLTAGQILGKKGAIEFVSSFSTSVVQSIFLTQPVKIILVASIYALVIRKPEKEEDDDEDDAKIIERENPHLANDEEFVHVIADIPKRVYYPPPDGHQLAAAREERLKELKMNKVIKEVSLYVFFVVLLMFVIYVERGPAGFYQNHSVKNVIELGVYAANSTNGDTTMSAVVSHEKFWYYMFHSFVPSIYSVLWHQGRRVNSKPGQKFIADDQNWMINAPRLRQLRLSPEKSCEIKNKLKALISECRDSYNMFDQEERQFKIGWKPINKSDSSDKPDVSWSYRTAIDLAGYPTSGVIATYSGGGYVADLGTTADQAYSNIQTLYDNSWIDRYTRAVFVEFVLINPNTNLYTTSAVIFEFISVGGIVPRPMFHTLRLGMVTGPSLYAVVALQILVAIFMIYYMVNEIKVMCKIKRPYFKEYFNILELLLVIFYIVVIVLYFVRFAASKIITNQVNKNKHRYVNFQYIVLMEETYTYICAFVAFFSTIKILKLLRFNKKVSMLSSVIRNSVKPIFNFLIMFSIVFFAFVQLALLLFSADLSGFKSTVRTMETLFVMLLNKFDYKSFEKGSPVFGPVFFFFFTVLVTFVLMNFFISVIMESYYVVKQDLLKQSNEYEIVDYIMKRFKTFVGKTGPGRRTANMTSGDNNEYTYEHYVEGNDNFEEFEERIEKLLTFLDNYINPPVDVDKADVLLQETEYTSMRKCKSDHLKPNETVQK